MKTKDQTAAEMKHIIPAALLIAGFIAALSAVWRDIWFDEAMTVLFYASKDSLAEIYRDYSMANNHIGYSMLLSIWRRIFPDSVYLWRFSSVLPALLALLILFRKHWREAGGKENWAIILGCFAISPCFSIYSTALRGYMWSFLAVLLVYENIRTFFAAGDGKWKSFCWYILSCLWALLLLPTNIYCACAALAFAAPEKWWQKKKFWLAAAVLPMAFAVIYLPILEQLLKVAFSGETWHNHWLAGQSVVLGFVLTMLPVLVFFPFLKIRKLGMNFLNWGVLWCIPAVIIFSKYPPFPRNFFPLWPLLLILAGRGVCLCMSEMQTGTRKKVRNIMFLSILLWCGCERYFAGTFSGLCGGARFHRTTGQDDWFAPYYMDRDFSIAETASYITVNHPAAQVYVSFDADGFPFMLYGNPANYLLWNTPQTRLRPMSLVITAKDEPEEALTEVMNKFELVKKPQLIHKTGFHNIYSVR